MRLISFECFRGNCKHFDWSHIGEDYCIYKQAAECTEKTCPVLKGCKKVWVDRSPEFSPYDEIGEQPTSNVASKE